MERQAFLHSAHLSFVDDEKHTICILLALFTP